MRKPAPTEAKTKEGAIRHALSRIFRKRASNPDDLKEILGELWLHGYVTARDEIMNGRKPQGRERRLPFVPEPGQAFPCIECKREILPGDGGTCPSCGTIQLFRRKNSLGPVGD